MDASTIIQRLGLLPHPEGGYYREMYRSPDTIPATALPARYGHARSICTAIYFLLTGDTFSAFHRLRSDEFWFYHCGCAIKLFMIHPDGNMEEQLVGSDLAAGERPQVLIRAGTWFAAKITEPDGFTLISCTVSPGFDFADFELADRASLVKSFPQHQSIIQSLTRTP